VFSVTVLIALLGEARHAGKAYMAIPVMPQLYLENGNPINMRRIYQLGGVKGSDPALDSRLPDR
jgi:hypothetical protein